MSKSINQLVGADMHDLGEVLICTEVSPSYIYEDGSRTEKTDGTKITVACPKLHYEKISIKVPERNIDPESLIDKRIKFEGLTGHFYVIDKRVGLSAAAKSYKVIA